MRLSKTEVFAACQVLADADRLLLRSGALREAEALADLFELFEERLALGSRCPTQSDASLSVASSAGSVASSAGSNSMESELTQ